MSKKNKIRILIIILLSICIGTTVSNAAIEIKPGTSPHVNITASTSYEYCYNMRAYSSSLGANSLDPHLTTNADWAAAAYLGLSGYGYVRTKEGNPVTIGEATYYSTTQNATGVMDMGKNYTQTASNFGRIINGNRAAETINLYNARYTKYVDLLSQEDYDSNKKGLAIEETKGWFNSSTGYNGGSINSYYILPRSKVIGYGSSTTAIYSGASSSTATYRPVIWN